MPTYSLFFYFGWVWVGVWSCIVCAHRWAHRNRVFFCSLDDMFFVCEFFVFPIFTAPALLFGRRRQRDQADPASCTMGWAWPCRVRHCAEQCLLCSLFFAAGLRRPPPSKRTLVHATVLKRVVSGPVVSGGPWPSLVRQPLTCGPWAASSPVSVMQSELEPSSECFTRPASPASLITFVGLGMVLCNAQARTRAQGLSRVVVPGYIRLHRLAFCPVRVGRLARPSFVRHGCKLGLAADAHLRTACPLHCA